MVLIIAAWFIGKYRYQQDLMPSIQQALPAANRFEQIQNDFYAGYADESETALTGYVALGQSSGYGGPLMTVVGFDVEGEILKVIIAENRETPAYLERVRKAGLLEKLVGKSAGDSLILDQNIDAVTSATITSQGIVDAVLSSNRAAGEYLGIPVDPTPDPKVKIGLPEIVLLTLFAVGYFGHQPHFKYKKTVRWLTMAVGLVVLGFLYNQPLTLAYVNKFLMGYWPRWQTNLYWYLLIGGILFVYTVDCKNPYCQWFCPFGAAQEVMGLIGGAKLYSPGRYKTFLLWLKRGLVVFAMVVALIFRSPGLTSYEVFGTLFSLLGSNLQYLLLVMVLLTAMFIRRPWCSFLCPLGPVMDFIRLVRIWIFELWQKTIESASER